MHPKGLTKALQKLLKRKNTKCQKFKTFSNEYVVRNMPLPKMFVITLKSGTHTSLLNPKNISYKMHMVFDKITFHKCSLTENVNYLVKVMNKFVKGSINVKRQTKIQR